MPVLQIDVTKVERAVFLDVVERVLAAKPRRAPCAGRLRGKRADEARLVVVVDCTQACIRLRRDGERSVESAVTICMSKLSVCCSLDRPTRTPQIG